MTSQVSVTSAGKQGGKDRTNNGSNAPEISADGRYVVFHSADSNLVAGDTNRTFDIFAHDRRTGKTSRISVSSGGAQANGENLGGLTISEAEKTIANALLTGKFLRQPQVSILVTTLKGSQDMFVAKLNAAGSTLLFSTYLGGNGDDYPSGIAVDAHRNIYVAGRTTSSNFPNVRAIQPNYRGGQTDPSSGDGLIASIAEPSTQIPYTIAASGGTSFAASVVGGADETSTFYSTNVNPSLLLNGTNVLAVEIHQANTNSSDISFDLDLCGSATPPNQGPSVNAGADQTVTLPASASLNGDLSDDGLPIPPGLLTFGWTKFSGPGTVTFANANALNTTAGFSTAGTYVLRLTASDGASSVSDDMTVAVNGQVQPPLHIDSVDWSSGTSSVLQIRFTAVAGQTYTVQYRDSLSAGGWLKLVDAQAVAQTVEVTDPTVTNSTTRYYRIVTPQQ